MTPRTASFLFLFFLGGLFLWRETTDGFFRQYEQQAVNLVADGPLLKRVAPPTLVLQGGAEGGELDALDIALFTRAAARLGASVAAVVAFQYPESGLTPNLALENGINFVCGSILVGSGVSSGVEPLEVAKKEKSGDWELESFASSQSGFPRDVGWNAGFLNLGSGKDGEGRLVVVANQAGKPVASFALAVLAASGKSAVPELQKDLLRLGNRVLPLDLEGRAGMKAGMIRSMNRLDMDDLLLEAERFDQERPRSPEVIELVEGRILLLGSLTGAGGRDIQLDTGRRLSLVEYQGMAVAALQAGFSPGRLSWPWEIGIAAVLAFLPLVFSLFRPLVVCAVLLSVLLLWVGVCYLVVLQTGFSPPVLFPLFMMLLSVFVRLDVRKTAGKKSSE